MLNVVDPLGRLAVTAVVPVPALTTVPPVTAVNVPPATVTVPPTFAAALGPLFVNVIVPVSVWPAVPLAESVDRLVADWSAQRAGDRG